MSAQLHPVVVLRRGKERAPGTHWIGSLVGPRAGLDDVERRKIGYCGHYWPIVPAPDDRGE
jgi:hypothetical protein